MAGHFGIITYSAITNISGMPKLLGDKVPRPNSAGQGMALRTVNWDKFSPLINRTLRKQLQKLIAASINNTVGKSFSQSAKSEYAGSDSYILGQRTVIKLIPITDDHGVGPAVGRIIRLGAGCRSSARLLSRRAF